MGKLSKVEKCRAERGAFWRKQWKKIRIRTNCWSPEPPHNTRSVAEYASLDIRLVYLCLSYYICCFLSLYLFVDPVATTTRFSMYLSEIP